MKLLAESTTKIVTLCTPAGDVPARIWTATTEHGVRCHLYVTRVAVAENEDQRQFQAELEEHEPPTPDIQAIPTRLIL